MKIYPGENLSGQVSRNRVNERPVARGSSDGRQAVPAATGDSPIPEIRKQMLVVQRTLGRYQSILGGFEGFQRFLQSSAAAEDAEAYLRKVAYRGEAVLEPFKVELARILATRDTAALQRLIQNLRTEIHRFAVQLSRLETAEQNSRSVNSTGKSLTDILRGIKTEGDLLLDLEGENVLKLLS
jgi:hypothetical protein